MEAAKCLDGKLEGLVSSALPAIIHVRELTRPEGYPVSDMRRVDTRFGKAVAVTVTLTSGEGRTAFLPRRFERALTEEDVAQFNGRPGLYRIRCTNPSTASPEVRVFASSDLH